ncbi:MAG: AI-2E family transporter [Rhodobiaceae bacterium]|nr:AI-2E family transporter [Rhodobiaceae bacterium]
MTIQRQALVWGIGFVVFLTLVWALSGILLPFVAGLAVAYLLDPAADRLEALGLSRLAATTLITFLCMGVFLVALMVLLPLLYEQTVNFVQAIPELVDSARDLLASMSDGYLAKIFAYAGVDLGQTMSGSSGGVQAWLLRQLASGWEQGIAVLGLLSLLIVTPIVAFYMLLDWDNMVDRIDGLVPRDHVGTVRRLAREIDEVLAGFVRGQGAVCLLLGGFYGIGLTLLGLQFGLIVGLIAGLISFIPYVGSIVGFFVAVTIAIFQFWPEYGWIIAVASVFAVGQFFEGNFLTPKLVGGRVRLHPLWVMLALFAFGYLFGFLGMLIAVPVAAAMGVFVRFAAAQYLRSALYRGEGRNEGEA